MQYSFVMADLSPQVWDWIKSGSICAPILGVAGWFVGIYSDRRKRHDQKEDREADRKEKADAGYVEVQKLKITNATQLYEIYEAQLQRVLAQANARIDECERKIGVQGRIIGKLRAALVNGYIIANRLQDRNFTLLGIVTHLKPEFDTRGFAPLDLSMLDPARLLLDDEPAPVQVHVTVPSGTDPSKITGKIVVPGSADSAIASS